LFCGWFRKISRIISKIKSVGTRFYFLYYDYRNFSKPLAKTSGVYTDDGSRLLVDVAVGDATAPSYRKPPPPSSPPRTRRSIGDRVVNAAAITMMPTSRIPHSLATPGNRLSSNKFRPFLGADVDNHPRRFVPFVLEASGRLGTAAGAFLEYLRTLCTAISQYFVSVPS
jgi:hypothetical protein